MTTLLGPPAAPPETASAGARTPEIRPPETRRVVSLVLGGVNDFEVAIAGEVFGTVRAEVLNHPTLDHWYDYTLCTPDPSTPLASLGGAMTTIPNGLDTLATAHLIIVPVCPKSPGSDQCHTGSCTDVSDDVDCDNRLISPETAEALRDAHDRGAMIMSFCSGAFALAQAGILNGRRATTHWIYTEEFRARFPQVNVVEDVLYVDEGNVMTSAGSAAGIDLALHFVRREHGADVADLLARRMVVPPHRDGGQAQYATRPITDLSETSFADILDFMVANLDADLPVAELAEKAAMSPRSFARHFQQATGATPHQWLTARRVDHARRLLESTDHSIDRIARDAGLGSAANLRARLHAAVGVTPTGYRRRFDRC